MSTIGQAERDVTEREEKAFALIEREGGIHQSEFWKAMDVSSRTGSRIIGKLLEKGLVEREETVYEGRVTYYVTPAHSAEDLDFSLLMAGGMMSPFIGDEEVDSQSDSFSQWVMQLAHQHQQER